MKAVGIVFWICAGIAAYTFFGYGILLWVAVRIKELFRPPLRPGLPDELPQVTLLVAAYNEQDVVAEKMENCRGLDYPFSLLRIVWVTDGSTDDTVKMLTEYRDVTVLHEDRRAGKAAALNRAMQYVETPITVFTDANTMLCPQAVKEIVRALSDPKVGCAAGEKRVGSDGAGGAVESEGIYWRYEAALKELDCRLYSAVGAAGELFAVRTSLFVRLPEDTLLDDFVLSLEIVRRGYKIAYCRDAYAVETSSADMAEEAKRKVRIAAGGWQASWRLRRMLDVFRYGVFSVQFLSRKVLRWTLAPVALFLMFPLNAVLAVGSGSLFYVVLLVLQTAFYLLALYGCLHSSDRGLGRPAALPYYFVFMNANALRGLPYLRRNRGRGVWEKARRAGA